jgi:hypothetical protein
VLFLFGKVCHYFLIGLADIVFVVVTANSQHEVDEKKRRRSMPNGDTVTNSIQTLDPKDVLKEHGDTGRFPKLRVISTLSPVVVR